MNLVEQIFGPSRLSEIRDTVALKWATGSCTYRELACTIQSVSLELNKRGVRTGQRVVLQCADTVNFVSTYFAVLNIGAVAIAVSTRLDETELAYVICDSLACALIVDATSAEANRPHPRNGENDIQTICLDDLCIGQGDAQGLQSVARDSHHAALWVYSSGSTSRPKGIVHTHGNILACSKFHSRNLEVKQADVIFCTSKLSFAYALANGLMAPLQLGATVFLHPDWITLTDFRSIITSQQPRIVFSVPSVYRNMLDQVCQSDAGWLAIPDHYVSAGEHLPADVRTRWHALCGRVIINAYGCSETLFLALAGNVHDTPLNSVGKLLPGVDGQLRELRQVNTIDSGTQGVLSLTHPFMFSHYANRVDDTAARLVDGRFNTGDLYCQDKHGNWYHLGREDELIKVAGQWVYLREIEKVARASPAVLDVAVVSAHDDAGMVRPALFFEPGDEVVPDHAVADMRQHIELNLPTVKWPSWVRAVKRLPRTANGKISRSELQQVVAGLSRDSMSTKCD